MSSRGQISAFPSEGRHNPRSPAPGPRCRCPAVIYPLMGHRDARTDSPTGRPWFPPGLAQGLPVRENLAKSVWGPRPTARVRGSPAACLTASFSGPEGFRQEARQERTDARGGSPWRVGRNPESRPPILGSSRAGASLPPEPPGPLRHCCRHSLYAAPSAVVDRRLKIGNRSGREPRWGQIELAGAQGV